MGWHNLCAAQEQTHLKSQTHEAALETYSMNICFSHLLDNILHIKTGDRDLQGWLLSCHLQTTTK